MKKIGSLIMLNLFVALMMIKLQVGTCNSEIICLFFTFIKV